MEFLKIGVMLILTLSLSECGKGKKDDGAKAPPVSVPENQSGDPSLTTPPTNKTAVPNKSADDNKTTVQPAAPDGSARIEGSFFNTEAKQLTLTTYATKPVVVMISAFGCQSCAEETQKLKQYLSAKHGGKLPANVDLITILINSVKEDANDWQTFQAIPWLVGYQADDQLITKYCKAMTTPCTLVRLPQKGIVFSQNGVVAPQDLEHLTGDWQ